MLARSHLSTFSHMFPHQHPVDTDLLAMRQRLTRSSWIFSNLLLPPWGVSSWSPRIFLGLPLHNPVTVVRGFGSFLKKRKLKPRTTIPRTCSFGSLIYKIIVISIRWLHPSGCEVYRNLFHEWFSIHKYVFGILANILNSGAYILIKFLVMKISLWKKFFVAVAVWTNVLTIVCPFVKSLFWIPWFLRKIAEEQDSTMLRSAR